MKNQAIFSSKDISKLLKLCLLQFLFGALRANLIISQHSEWFIFFFFFFFQFLFSFFFCSTGTFPNILKITERELEIFTTVLKLFQIVKVSAGYTFKGSNSYHFYFLLPFSIGVNS